MDFSNWIPRSHYLGLLMTPARGKSYKQKLEDAKLSLHTSLESYSSLQNIETKTAIKLAEKIGKLNDETIPFLKSMEHIPMLSEVCKKKLAEIWTCEDANVTKDIKSKFISKGLDLEEDALTAFSLFTGELYNKNTERKSNEWIEGGCDSLDESFVIDTKVSWDIFSFDSNRFKPINPIYKWQLKAYCWLYNRSRGKLVYTLLNTPEYLIQSEERKLAYELFGELSSAIDNPYYVEACKDLRRKHIHDHLPAKRKIQIYEIETSDDDIEAIKNKVSDCRYYLNNIEKIDQNEQQEEEIQAA